MCLIDLYLILSAQRRPDWTLLHSSIPHQELDGWNHWHRHAHLVVEGKCDKAHAEAVVTCTLGMLDLLGSLFRNIFQQSSRHLYPASKNKFIESADGLCIIAQFRITLIAFDMSHNLLVQVMPGWWGCILDV